MIHNLPTGVVTLLFTDVEGSTRLLHSLGDEYGQALHEHRRRLRAAFADHEGLRPRMLHDGGEFVGGQMGVQRDEAQPRFVGGERALDQGVAVVGEHTDRIAGMRTERSEQVGDLVGVTGEFTVGPGTVGALEDGRQFGLVLGDPPEAQPSVPWVVHQ